MTNFTPCHRGRDWLDPAAGLGTWWRTQLCVSCRNRTIFPQSPKLRPPTILTELLWPSKRPWRLVMCFSRVQSLSLRQHLLLNLYKLSACWTFDYSELSSLISINWNCVVFQHEIWKNWDMLVFFVWGGVKNMAWPKEGKCGNEQCLLFGRVHNTMSFTEIGETAWVAVDCKPDRFNQSFFLTELLFQIRKPGACDNLTSSWMSAKNILYRFIRDGGMKWGHFLM